MPTRPLEYESSYISPELQFWSLQSWPWRKVVVGAIILIAMLLLFTVPLQTVETRIDSVTGSMSTQTTWIGGITDTPTFQVSPLEARLKQSGMTWTPVRCGMHSAQQNVFGATISRGCGSAPPIFTLQSFQALFVHAASDEELRTFVTIMQSGSDPQQSAAIDAAIEKALP